MSVLISKPGRQQFRVVGPLTQGLSDWRLSIARLTVSSRSSTRAGGTPRMAGTAAKVVVAQSPKRVAPRVMKDFIFRY